MRRLATFGLFTTLTFAFLFFLVSMFAVHLEVGTERSIHSRTHDVAYSSVDEIIEPERRDLLRQFREDAYVYSLVRTFSVWLPGGLVVLLALTRIFLRPPRPRMRTVLAWYAVLCIVSAALTAAYQQFTTGAVVPADVWGPVAFVGLLALLCTSLLLLGSWFGDDFLDAPPVTVGTATQTPSGEIEGPPKKRLMSKTSPILLILAPSALLAAVYVGHEYQVNRQSIQLPDVLSVDRALHVLRGAFPPAVDAVRGEQVELPDGRRVFVIRGRVAGQRTTGQTDLRVKATLYGPGTQPLVSREVDPGVLLSHTELATLTPREMDKRFQTPLDADSSAISSEFMVPFLSPPPGIRKFHVGIVPGPSHESEVSVAGYFLRRVKEEAGTTVYVRAGRTAPTAMAERNRSPATVPWTEVDVASVQWKLNALGFNAGTVDGIAGRGTRSALKAFQETAGLLGTGVPDERTMQLLDIEKPWRSNSSGR